MIEIAELDTPLGTVQLAARRKRVVGLTFGGDWPRIEALVRQRFPDDKLVQASNPAGAIGYLQAYFAGEIDALSKIEIDVAGTDFQHRVWDAIREIPGGDRLSYAGLARVAKAPRAVRAAGTACGANRVALIIPCHRVVRSDGNVGNYGGGPKRKSWLLEFEQRNTQK